MRKFFWFILLFLFFGFGCIREQSSGWGVPNQYLTSEENVYINSHHIESDGLNLYLPKWLAIDHRDTSTFYLTIGSNRKPSLILEIKRIKEVDLNPYKEVITLPDKSIYRRTCSAFLCDAIYFDDMFIYTLDWKATSSSIEVAPPDIRALEKNIHNLLLEKQTQLD